MIGAKSEGRVMAPAASNERNKGRDRESTIGNSLLDFTVRILPDSTV